MKDDNSGSVIVMVLVAFMFVSILVAIILSSTVVNFRMRSMDRSVKNEFYYAEKALDDIYAGVGLEASQLMGTIYNRVLGGAGYSYGYSAEIENEAIMSFNELFTKKLESIYTDSSDSDYIELKDYIVRSDPAREVTVEWDGTIQYKCEGALKRLSVIDNLSSLPKTKNDKGRDVPDYRKLRSIVLHNVKVSSKNPDDFISYITTDIVVEMPSIDFITVNTRGMDFAIIANDGVYFEGAPSTVKGNIYGGGLTTNKINAILDTKSGSDKRLTSEEMGGINIKGSTVTIDGTYIVSGADINIDDSDDATVNGKLIINTSDSECEVWFENLNINTNKTSVPASRHDALVGNATFYALDDLVINGNSSRAVFEGAYFGYNDGVLEDGSPMLVKTKDYVTDLSDGNKVKAISKDSASSSIIVNGKNSEIDMKAVQTFVILGKAYINHTNKENTVYISNLDNTEPFASKTKNIPINESVALKSDQEIYLVPTEFLQSTNPVVTTDVNIFNEDNVDIPSDWFGYDYLDTTSSNKLFKTVFVHEGSKDIAYCYLNFKDDESRVQFLEDIIPHVINKNNTSPEDIVGPKTGTGYDDVSPTPTELYTRLKTISDTQGSKIYIGKTGKKGQPNGKIESDEIHIYSNNGIVQNSIVENVPEQTITMKGNNEGIQRFQNYKTNMYNKYRWLDTYLDTQEAHSLTNLMYIGAANFNWTSSATDDTDYDDDGLPLSRIIWTNNGGVSTVKDGFAIDKTVKELPGTVVVVKGDYEFGNSIPSTDADGDSYFNIVDNSFDGFILVDGDVTVPAGKNINGFIYATGKVTLKGNNKITYDSSLYQRRVEEEVNIAKEAIKKSGVAANAYKNYYLSSYMLNIRPHAGTTIRNKTYNTAEDPIKKYLKYYYDKVDDDAQTVRDYNIDYRDFVMYENWRKGTN